MHIYKWIISLFSPSLVYLLLTIVIIFKYYIYKPSLYATNVANITNAWTSMRICHFLHSTNWPCRWINNYTENSFNSWIRRAFKMVALINNGWAVKERSWCKIFYYCSSVRETINRSQSKKWWSSICCGVAGYFQLIVTRIVCGLYLCEFRSLALPEYYSDCHEIKSLIQILSPSLNPSKWNLSQSSSALFFASDCFLLLKIIRVKELPKADSSLKLGSGNGFGTIFGV